jgi:SAM-dependent methyltransferase
MTETAYDRVAYPSAIVRAGAPERLAIIARLHGLSPPPADTARVLEIGGGDAANALSLAAAHPQASFLSFDLAASAVARGQAFAAAAGLDNCEIRTLDILDAQAEIAPGSFDYIIAHGIYAWVPEPVRAAVMALIGHALSPDGVAFVSYNALPGGHIRQIMREMLLFALAAFLRDYADPRDGDEAPVALMRLQAKAMLDRPPEVLFHDELGGIFAPQSLSSVITAAEEAGLRFLNDAGSRRTTNGFFPEGMSEAEGIAREQADDYAGVAFFRQTLFVRAGDLPRRQPQLDVLDSLYASGSFIALDLGALKSNESEFTLRDSALTGHLLEIAAAAPRYVPIASLNLTTDQKEAVLNLFDLDLLQLRTGPGTFVTSAGDRPVASPLVRAHLANGQNRVVTLDHTTISIDDPAASTLIQHLDGSRDRAALESLWATLEHPPALTLDGALAMLAKGRLLRA